MNCWILFRDKFVVKSIFINYIEVPLFTVYFESRFCVKTFKWAKVQWILKLNLQLMYVRYSYIVSQNITDGINCPAGKVRYIILCIFVNVFTIFDLFLNEVNWISYTHVVFILFKILNFKLIFESVKKVSGWNVIITFSRAKLRIRREWLLYDICMSVRVGVFIGVSVGAFNLRLEWRTWSDSHAMSKHEN